MAQKGVKLADEKISRLCSLSLEFFHDKFSIVSAREKIRIAVPK
jgi:hypothetical protein